MSAKTYTVEQIISMLREAEGVLGQGQTAKDICRKLGITDPTYYRRGRFKAGPPTPF